MDLPLLFRILYSAFFSIVYLVLLLLLVVTPADTIHQALQNHQLYNVFVIAACYFVTLFLVVLIYAARLYTTRSVLAGIPKTYIPVESGDVGKSVRKMIVEGLSRSAVIAWEASPRISSDAPIEVPAEDEDRDPPEQLAWNEKSTRFPRLLRRKRKMAEKGAWDITIPSHYQHVWNDIAHDGWSPPSSSDIPNLQYATVILELPHLIEAKAVSLAPPDANSNHSPPMPDLRAIELLQRPVNVGLREYLPHLTSLGILSATAPVASFISSYETARFAAQPIDEKRFRELMKSFAEILRSMVPLDAAFLNAWDDEVESDIDGDASSTPTQNTSPSPSRASSQSSRSGSQATIRTAPSRQRSAPGTMTPLPRMPVTLNLPKSNSPARDLTRMAPDESSAKATRPYGIRQASYSSSLRSSSGGSVIRLNHSQSQGDLPYTLHIPPS
ncbi:MAG: hypothetical protein M1818_007050 [Claussenomyces sp. TS43310]|nr:MAG: hypothetical protein M1818_007050 [Claussenomyces sp. TS43310]